MTCARCGKNTSVHIMSVFNTDLICLECQAKERLHPKYDEARTAENNEVRKGNYNYEGIGKPSDL